VDAVAIKVLGQEMVLSLIYRHGNVQDGFMVLEAAGTFIGKTHSPQLINPSPFQTNPYLTSLTVLNVVHLCLPVRTIVQAAG